jgi:hypothetical protein
MAAGEALVACTAMAVYAGVALELLAAVAR